MAGRDLGGGTVAAGMPIASFHLATYRWGQVPAELVRYVTVRRHLRAAPGLRFWRVLGTGRGRTMSVSADLCRWALFAVWDDDAALDDFLADSPMARRWARAAEAWHVRLRPAGGHGTWAGVDVAALLASSGGAGPPEEGAGAGDGAADDGEGPVAVLTRASVRSRRLAPFLRAVPPVDAALVGHRGLLAAVGAGEWPVLRQATFSLWASADDVARFAYRDPVHAEVVRRTREEAWYRDELFMRFRPYRSTGTWSESDPLAR
jgi:hypothetical protein